MSTPSGLPSVLGVVWVIFRKEFVELLRDRRAVFFAFVLPILLYPILFLSVGSLSRRWKEGGEVRVGVAGEYGDFVPFTLHKNIAIEEAQYDPAQVRSGALDAFLCFGDCDHEPCDRARLDACVQVYYASTSPGSEAARARIRSALDKYQTELLRRRFASKGQELDPARTVAVEIRDVSTAEERNATRLGRFLPMLLVILLLTGGSFAALDLVAGEKERGTLETLFINPVPLIGIVWGKFLVVLAVCVISVLLNFCGMLLALGIELLLAVAPAGWTSAGALLPPLSTLAVILALITPLAVLTSAVLLALSAFARSFREAQTYLLPATLVALVAILLASSPRATLGSLVALVPVANVALAIREALEGQLTLQGFLLVFLSSSLYAAAALAKTSRLLREEEVVLNLEPPPLAGAGSAEGRARRAILFGWMMLLFLYFGASALQRRHQFIGLSLTLWVLVLLPSLLYPLAVKVPFRETLGLKGTPLTNFLLAPLIALAGVVLVNGYATFQRRYLPMPSEMEEAFSKLFAAQDLPLSLAFFLLAISPGICEELLWRGAFQGDLEPRGRPARTILTVGVFFGLFHLSAYRLVPTALLGIVLALIRHRTGSVFPCMLAHASYNAALLGIFLAERQGWQDQLGRLLEDPPSLLAAGLLLALCVRGLRRG